MWNAFRTMPRSPRATTGQLACSSTANFGLMALGEGVNFGVESLIGRQTTGLEHFGIGFGSMTITSVSFETMMQNTGAGIFRNLGPTFMRTVRGMPMGVVNVMPISTGLSISANMIGVDSESTAARWIEMAAASILGAYSTN